MIELQYPQNISSAAFKPKFGANLEIKPKKQSDTIFEQFYDINPDSFNEQTRKDNEFTLVSKQVIDLTEYPGNIAPLQDNTYSLGVSGKTWAKVRSYSYADQTGLDLPIFGSVQTSSGTISANNNKGVLSLTSSNSSIAITSNDITDTVNFTTNTSSLQSKVALTIGFSNFNDFVVNPVNTIDAFTSLIAYLSSGNSPTKVFVEDGTYFLNGTLIIPNDINLTLIGTKGKCQFVSLLPPDLTVQFGGSSTPFTNYYQVIEGVYFESITLRSVQNIVFDGCILNKLTIGNSLSESPFAVRFNNCDTYGMTNMVNAYDIAFTGGRTDCVGSPLIALESSSNIRFHAMSIYSPGTMGGSAVFTLRDTAGVESSRIMVDGCVIENYSTTIPLIFDLRSNTNSRQLRMNGLLRGVSFNPPSYFNPSTNKFDF